MEVEIEVAVKPETPAQLSKVQDFFDTYLASNADLVHASGNSPDILKSRLFDAIKYPNTDFYNYIDDIKVVLKKLPSEADSRSIVHAHFLYHDESQDDIVDNDGEILSIATQTILPSIKFIADWDSVIFDDTENNIKNTLLKFMETSVNFADSQVCPDVVTSNRILLLYGPPGTGKTTICHGLAQKLSIVYSQRFTKGTILEVNTHSLFSKWFAESGKMVKKLFTRLNEIASDTSVLVFVLIDEVESLATARQSSMNGSDPSDAIRVVNALLTQLDQLRKRTNVIVMATSNLTECIDFAFLSRADIRQWVGPPSTSARYMILKSCIDELADKRILEPVYSLLDVENYKLFTKEIIESNFGNSQKLMHSAELCEGMCGRILRRLPFLAFVYKRLNRPAPFDEFIEALNEAIKRQITEEESVSGKKDDNS